jgi:hypothetical protein
VDVVDILARVVLALSIIWGGAWLGWELVLWGYRTGFKAGRIEGRREGLKARRF